MKNLRNIVLFIVFSLIALVFLVGWWVYKEALPVDAQDKKMQTFVIKSGSGVSAIAKQLHDEGLIKNPMLFKLLIKQQKIEKSIQAGSFKLSANMGLLEIANNLTKGTQDTWITLPEGMRREEMAERLLQYDLENFDVDLFLTLTKDLEGKLFPDTYLVPQMISTQALVSLLNSTFEARLATLDFSQNDLLDPNQHLVLASLIQREARTQEDMYRVAGILQNRIRINMPLQVDATLQYVRGYSQTHQRWWGYPVPDDKFIQSEFNTYQVAGLPPQPIASPGLVAIEASLNPTLSDDLFYIHAPDGKMYYAKTLDGHNQNINKYLR